MGKTAQKLVYASFFSTALLAACLGGTPVLMAALALVPPVWMLHVVKSGRKAPRWLLSLAVFNALLMAPELALRLADFRHETGVAFGFPRPTFLRTLKLDPTFFWTHRPGLPGVNKQGFVAPPLETPKTHIPRILFLGDSVTHQGLPAMVEAHMAAKGIKVQALNYAVPGYSSYQGKKVWEQFSAQLQPDITVIMFGWNDQWQAYGAPDNQKKTPPPSNPLTEDLYHRYRLLQGLTWLKDHLSGQAPKPLAQPRVSPTAFKGHLEALTAQNPQSYLLITPPSAHDKLGVPPYLTSRGFASSKAKIQADRKIYNEKIRSIKGPLLLDAAKIWQSFSKDETQALFTYDGIHLTPKGLTLLAGQTTEILLPTLSITARQKTAKP